MKPCISIKLNASLPHVEEKIQSFRNVLQAINEDRGSNQVINLIGKILNCIRLLNFMCMPTVNTCISTMTE